jgi:hypothetical protein
MLALRRLDMASRLLATCKKVHQEAEAIMIRENTFYFSFQDTLRSGDRPRHFKEFIPARPTPIHNFTLIQHLDLDFKDCTSRYSSLKELPGSLKPLITCNIDLEACPPASAIVKFLHCSASTVCGVVIPVRHLTGGRSEHGQHPNTSVRGYYTQDEHDGPYRPYLPCRCWRYPTMNGASNRFVKHAALLFFPTANGLCKSRRRYLEVRVRVLHD